MRDVRHHPISRDVVLVSTSRSGRPGAWSESGGQEIEGLCPFCPGNEAETPPEIESAGGGEWTFRVVPNKYPALERSKGHVAHEVVIDARAHDLPFQHFSRPHLEAAIEVWMRRAREQGENRDCRYVAVFRNEGRGAGQSIPHPHGQILALDFVPPRIERELEGFRNGCPVCARLSDSQHDRCIIDRTPSLILMSHPAARMPLEMWVTSTTHASDWTTAARGELAELLLSGTRRLRRLHPDAPFNLGMITAPIGTESADSFHWYAEISPRLTRIAGFELSTGCWINIDSPEHSAARLRAAGDITRD